MNYNIPRNKFHQFKKLRDRSRELRKTDTIAEQKLWEILRRKNLNNLKFYRQKIIGEFILDFYCHELRLDIELDGEIHKNLKERDVERDRYLIQNFNLKIVRLDNNFIIKNSEENIKEYLIKSIKML